jgi:hypothetical protein
MKLAVLNRIRQGNEIVAEVSASAPGFRRWVSVKKPRTRDPRDPLYEGEPAHQYEISVAEQPIFEDPYYFYENEGYRTIELHKVRDEEALMKLLPTLVPSTDLFDVPWRVYVP